MKITVTEEEFERIRAGLQIFQYSDALITFINDKTKEELGKEIIGARYLMRHSIPYEERIKPSIKGDFVLELELA